MYNALFMSYRINNFVETNNVNRFLKGLGSTERFSEKEKGLHKEYLSINSDHNHTLQDRQFLMSCAHLALEEMRSENSDIHLTEFGITFNSLLDRGDYYSQSEAQAIEEQFATRLAKLNKQFLLKWEKIRNRKLKEIQELQDREAAIKEIIKQTRPLIDNNRDIISQAKVVSEKLMNSGYKILNIDDVINAVPSVVWQKGLKIVAENAKKDVVEVIIFLPGGIIETHVQLPDSEECQKLAKEVRELVSAAITDFAQICCAPIRIGIKSQGLPKNFGSRNEQETHPIRTHQQTPDKLNN